MRINLRGVTRADDTFTFTYNGREIPAYHGESIAAALLAADEAVCRETARGEGRGMFCGMGVCGECTVLVDGQPQRACMEKARAGLAVHTQPARRALPEEAGEIHPRDWKEQRVDLLVVGAGPAGLAAAGAAAGAGASVLVVDERSQAGGQYFKQPGQGFGLAEGAVDRQFRQGRTLYREACEAGAEFRFSSTVWGVFPGPQIAVAGEAGNTLLRPRRIILAPGAFERPRPFPGWTLPGVMTTGAAQTLLRAYQTAPGKRVVVAGNGPLNLQVARELAEAGTGVAAVAELAPGATPGRLGQVLRMTLRSPDLVVAGLDHRLRLWRRGVPVFHATAVIRAEGRTRLEAVTVASVDAAGVAVAGTERTLACDTLCLGYGFLGQSEMARALQGICDVHNAVTAGADEGSAAGENAAVVVIGDAGGLGGARVALAQGALAGRVAARKLGYAAAPASGPAANRGRRILDRHLSFQRALWSFYKAPSATLAAADRDTIICRCESVTLGVLDGLRAAGVGSVGALKRESRAGMGRCQGRYCGHLLRECMGLSESDDGANFAPRPPFKPLTVAELAARVDTTVEFDRTAGMRDDAAGKPASGPGAGDAASAGQVPPSPAEKPAPADPARTASSPCQLDRSCAPPENECSL